MAPLLPILIPVVGAMLCPWGFLSHARLPLRRWLYVGIIGLTALGVLVVALQGAPRLEATRPLSHLEAAPTLVWTPLSLWVAAALLAFLLASELARRRRPLAPAHVSLRLLSLAACLGVLAAGNLLTLSVAWSVPLVSLLLARALWREGEAERPGPWEIWYGLFSSGLLILGAVAVTVQQGGGLELQEVRPGLALNALAASVALRVLTWPRVGGLRLRWESYLMSLVAGLYLWLRIGLSLQATGLSLTGGVAVGAVVLLAVLGLMGALQRRPGRALPYTLGHWLILALLAPLLDPDLGLVASLLIALHLLSSLLILRVYQTSPLPQMRPGRPLYLAAWASLGGLPLTLGFVAHWLVVRSCWQSGAATLVFWLLLGCLANAVPAWAQARTLAGDAPAEEGEAKADYVALVPAGLAAAILVILGIGPGLMAVLWPQAPLDLGVLGYGRLFAAGASPVGGLVLAAVLAPMLAGLTLHQRWVSAQAPSLRPFYRSRRVINAEWLYTVVREQIDRLLAILRQGLEIIEGSFSLVWILLWGIALVYYMVGV